jgi:hypothetical protein
MLAEKRLSEGFHSEKTLMCGTDDANSDEKNSGWAYKSSTKERRKHHSLELLAATIHIT